MNSRIVNIDFVKAVAMFTVIGLHTFGVDMDWHYVNILYEMCVIAIPLFFMSSGYIMLPREDITIGYVLKKELRLFRFLFFLSVSYGIISYINMSISYSECLNLIVGAVVSEPLYHCWFLLTMMILYIILPAFNWLFHNKFNSILLFVFILVVINNGIFVANLFFVKPIESQIAQYLRLYNWLFYFLVGGLLFIYKDKVKLRFKYFTIVTLLLLNVFFQELLRPLMNSSLCEYFYSSFFVELLSLSIFIYILHMKLNNSRSINLLSKLFLPVYIFHPFFIPYSNRICFHFFNVEFALFARFFVVSFLSISFSYLFMEIPYMSKVFKI